MQKAAAEAFAAFTIASSAMLVVAPTASTAILPPPSDAMGSSTVVVAEKVIREGVYREYEIDTTPQKYDDARSTFKAASETKSKKGMSLLRKVLFHLWEKSYLSLQSQAYTSLCFFIGRQIYGSFGYSYCWQLHCK